MLRRIAFIVFAQRIGLTLDEIGAELAKLPENRVPDPRDWAKLSRRWTSRIDDQIAELQRLQAGLTAVHRLRLPVARDCSLANPGDRAAGRVRGRATGSAIRDGREAEVLGPASQAWRACPRARGGWEATTRRWLLGASRKQRGSPPR